MAKTIHFNTDRKYTANGQRVTATLHDDGVVTFWDHDRMVDGEFRPLEWEEFSKATVMAWYDQATTPSSKRSWEDAMREDGCNAKWEG